MVESHEIDNLRDNLNVRNEINEINSISKDIATALSMKCIKQLERHRQMASKRFFQLESINRECNRYIGSLQLQANRSQGKLELGDSAERNMCKDDMGSVYKESGGLINSDGSCEMDEDMSVDSIERRALFKKKETNGRKKLFHKVN